MTPFLKQIAELFYEHYGANVQRIAFVFPNRRSGLFFRKYLSETASKPIFSPTILTINELFCKLNPKQTVDPVKLIFLLYDVYLRQSRSQETFDNFIHWGKMLLNDFDDMDKNLIDAKQLFTNVSDLNNIEKDFSFLKPSQVQAIRSFWSTFQPESGDTNKQNFLKIWELLYPIYTEFREMLAVQGFAYEGMIYREVVENWRGSEQHTIEEQHTTEERQTDGEHFGNKAINNTLSYEKIIFVGLNALTKAEQALLKLLKQEQVADFYWDYTSDKAKNEHNRASFFMKDNVRMFPSAFLLPEEEPVDTQVELIGIPSRIGQAKQLYPILEQISGQKRMTAEEALRTAVVLPDEQLLLPVLHSIPEQIDQINVTLGYPLSGTLVATLMTHLQSLQKRLRKTDEETLFYHSDVIAVLQHPAVSSVCPEEATDIRNNIIERNQVYIPESILGATPFLKILFAAPTNAMELSDYLLQILFQLKIKDTLEQEFVFHYFTMVNRIREMIRETNIEMSTDTYFRLLKQMADFIRIPFQGEPLSGLQVMGVLETRVLDFDNIIILSVNEGIFPAKISINSFIPYHLRRGFGLPTPEHQDSVWAYHFYRMIHRAKRVILLYDTRTDGLQSGEVSRFVHQLRYHYKTPIRQKVTVYNVASSAVKPFIVEKDEEVNRTLALFETEKSLSASAINTYLDCPLRFYFAVIRGIDEEKAVSEMLRHDLFGTLLHRVMELAYQPFCGKTVTSDLLKLVSQEKNMTELIQTAFAKDYFHTDDLHPLTGQTYLYSEIIRKYVCKILAYDQSLTPFDYIGSEKLFHRTLDITGGRKIRIKGFIDRIDRVNGALRIIDYKSGKPSALTFASMESLFGITEKDRKKAIMQVFLYAYIYALETNEKQIQPVIYYTRDLFKPGEFDPVIRQQVEKEKKVIDRFGDEWPLFEDCLRSCLDDLFDSNIPFAGTSIKKNCEFCYYKTICT